MINRLLYRLTAGLPCRLIKLDGRPYLERYYVGRLFGVTFYLHRFVSSDSERHLHNHPWGWGRALVLTGAYDEESVVDLTPAAPDGCVTHWRRIRFWNRVDGNHFHRIAWVKPGTWTLFFHGYRATVGEGATLQYKGWGFLELRGDLVAFERFTASPKPWWYQDAPKGQDAGRVPL